MYQSGILFVEISAESMAKALPILHHFTAQVSPLLSTILDLALMKMLCFNVSDTRQQRCFYIVMF